MHIRSACFLPVLATLFAAPAQSQNIETLSRRDGASVRVAAYQPAAACRGLVVFSHGAGGSENAAGYLARALSSDGWLVTVVGHKESGMDAIRGRLRGRGLKGALNDLITEPSAYEARFMDIEAAREWGTARCKAPTQVLMGHSMGAATVMLEAGADNKLGLHGHGGFDAYVALSPQGAGTIFPRGAWRDIKAPVLTLTGTRDNELNSDWTSRLDPWNDMQPGCKWLGIIDGATHTNFAGVGMSSNTEALTVRTTLAFLSDVREGGAKRCPAPPETKGIELRTK